MLKRFSFLFSILIILITLIPFFLKTIHAPPETFFPMVPNDILLQDYYSDLASLRQGTVIFKEIASYTTEDVEPQYLHLYYLLVGKIGGIFNLSPLAIYYICEYATLIVFFLFIYLLVSTLVPKSYQLFSLFLIYFASPFPPYTISLFGNSFSIGEGWWTNQNIYERFFMRPLHLAGVTILLACSYFFIKFYRKPKISNSIICGLLCFFGILFSGTPEIIFTTTISIFLLIAFFMYLKTRLPVYKNRFLGLLAILIISLPALIVVSYQVSTSFFGSIIGNWEFVTFQKEIYPYTLGVYLLSFGLILPFILLSILYIFKKKTFEPLFILLLVLIPFCLYLLSVFGLLHISKIRFVYSAPYVFGGILASFGVMQFLEFIKHHIFKKIVWGFIIIIFITNSLFGLKSYWWPKLIDQIYSYNVYIPGKYFLLFDYINSSLPRYSTIMTSFGSGTFLPAFADVKVFVGHETGTINFPLKYQISQDISQQKYSLAEVKNILDKYQIQYVLWEELAAPTKYSTILKKIFQKDNVSLFKVI